MVIWQLSLAVALAISDLTHIQILPDPEEIKIFSTFPDTMTQNNKAVEKSERNLCQKSLTQSDTNDTTKSNLEGEFVSSCHLCQRGSDTKKCSNNGQKSNLCHHVNGDKKFFNSSCRNVANNKNADIGGKKLRQPPMSQNVAKSQIEHSDLPNNANATMRQTATNGPVANFFSNNAENERLRHCDTGNRENFFEYELDLD